jgi:hypothetical protein
LLRYEFTESSGREENGKAKVTFYIIRFFLLFFFLKKFGLKEDFPIGNFFYLR